jgi:protein-S-isoprenylcysteine O-methyltransferase Ste14
MMTPLVAKLIWIAGAIAWFVIRYPAQRRAARRAVVRSAVDWQERTLLVIAGLGQFVVPLIYVLSGEPRFADYPFHPLQGWLGLLLLIAALVLFRVTHKRLGRNWSITLEMRKSHALVTDGVYAYVRHPMYSSFFLWGLAQLALLPNWFAGPVGLVGIAILFFFRVGREEAMMIDTFGDSYADYMKRTARIVPWLY